ncbi:MAG TPA: hypothetical protein PLL10_08830, partial [Elusimicrobiales bacterium]|nr:hypothetical protein [Elusimicrobiales bacterium]
MNKMIPVAVCAALLFCGCAKKQVVKKPGPILKIASEDDSFNSTSRAGAQKLSFSRDSALENAHFDYDKSDLRQDTRLTLDKNTGYLK